MRRLVVDVVLGVREQEEQALLELEERREAARVAVEVGGRGRGGAARGDDDRRGLVRVLVCPVLVESAVRGVRVRGDRIEDPACAAQKYMKIRRWMEASVI